MSVTVSVLIVCKYECTICRCMSVSMRVSVSVCV